MKSVKWVVVLGLLAATMVSEAAWARGGGFHGGGGGFHGGFRGRVGLGVVIGAPLIGAGLYYGSPYYYSPYYSPYYYPPSYYYPPAYSASPPVYVEQSPAPQAAAPQQSNYWYYCRNPDGYYPYVKECPGGWQQVAPQPPARP
jgi:hypothetical protein